MNARTKLASSALLLAVGATVAASLPATAEPTLLNDGMLSAMQRDLGLTAEGAVARVAAETRAGAVEQTLRGSLGEAFGGAHFEAGQAKLVVGVTDAAKADLVRAQGAEPKLVARSTKSLDDVVAKLNTGKAATDVTSWHVDVASNKVVVTVQPGQAAKADELVARTGADKAAVAVVEQERKNVVLHDVRGGDAYYMGGRCSVGFSVQGGFVTAGHCGKSGTATQGFNQVAQGTFKGSSFPGNDYAWVQTNSDWTPKGVVNNYSGGTVAVKGSQEAAVGASICKSGSTTNWTCGTIQAKNETVNYAEGAVTGLTRSNARADRGDSGGSFISGDQAQGVTSGGDLAAGIIYFQPIGEILSAYSLKLVTS
ncbi:streptogrisin C [Crossiella equi]|uniref:Streptogrisin C n=1 Tax=Crossiella equi TaxID=130796 RepID=A0ABS5ANL0_9PSEU|nr:alpha-lytic protease prodomain-containing protein [Crossiella equi]MBP2477280.1 streptogrisin C [Crossiella equi]